MALIGAILASLSLTVIAYSVNILLGIFISGLLIMAFGIVIMLDNKYKKQVTMEWEIGEIKQVNGEWYQCIKGYHCHDCSFYIDKRCTNVCSLDGICFDSSRSDNTEVIFKKLEKVGEPYVGNNGTFQSYKLAMPIYGDIPDQIIGFTTTEVVIKQNEEDMEEKKDNYDGNMDKECIPICDALNSIPDVHTVGSCCGHCKNRFMIFLTCNNSHSLAIIAQVFNRRYIGTSQPWYIELQAKDSGAYNYFIHSETKYGSEEVMVKDVNQIIENIKYWCDDKFASHFKGCDDKPTLAPFDINLAKQGKFVCTRDGRKARIICFDRKYKQPIIALVMNEETGLETISRYFENGHLLFEAENKGDLMMLPEKKEGWINVYALNTCYSSKEEAEANIERDYEHEYVRTVKIEWEE